MCVCVCVRDIYIYIYTHIIHVYTYKGSFMFYKYSEPFRLRSPPLSAFSCKVREEATPLRDGETTFAKAADRV